MLMLQINSKIKHELDESCLLICLQIPCVYMPLFLCMCEYSSGFQLSKLMEDHHSGSVSHELERITEPVVRSSSRWTPKAEQILILECIFNSGMVNPPKDETVRIRKMLEKFGSVGDANVFYWFQNRRSRARRQQRLQAHNGLVAATDSTSAAAAITTSSGGSCCSSPVLLLLPPADPYVSAPPPCTTVAVSTDVGVNHILSSTSHHILGIQQEIEQRLIFSSSMLHSQPGYIIVFINGVPNEVPGGPFDMKAMFGQDLMLIDISGLPVPCNSYGIIMQSLQPGEKYFLVLKPT